MAIQEQEVGSAARDGNGKRSLPGIGLLKGLGVTLRHMLHRSVTQQYPHVKPDLPPRTRGVIALKTENCTVCYKCSRACPDWCIYIDAHKEQHTPASGGRGRSVKLLDRFAIDYALCMYCGICVEVCPFDALFWSPEFEYAEFDILNMTHEKERLEEWTYHVLPPPALEVGAEPMPTPEEAPVRTGGGEPVASRPPSAAETSRPGATPPAEMAPPKAQAEVPAEAAPAAEAGPPSAATAEPAMQAGTLPSAAARTDHAEVEPDQETFDRVLAEEVAKGTDRRVAEGRAKAAAIRAARKKAAGG
jgi:formate hydrogenlyase subunit 6/NADH:ubiquinone oxidoreductase subunit I